MRANLKWLPTDLNCVCARDTWVHIADRTIHAHIDNTILHTNAHNTYRSHNHVAYSPHNNKHLD